MKRFDISVIRRLILLPLGILGIFSSRKSFADAVLGCKWLNLAGLHVFRLILAHAVFAFKQFCMSGLVSAEDRKQFAENGFIVKQNFLTPEQFERLNCEARNIDHEARQCIQGDTLTQRVLLDSEVLEQMPACFRLFESKSFRRLLKYCSARNSLPIMYIQKIKNHHYSGKVDPQKTLHSDTFHPTMKAWLFLDDVSDDNGPFTYLPGSHKLTWARLKWEYRQSVLGRSLQNPYSIKGSLRVGRKDLDFMQLGQAQALKVRANTLVIANTHGFHCRGQAEQRSSRMEIWAYSRCNPFNPWIGLDSALIRGIEHRVIQRYLDFKDRQASQSGRLASWHKVSPEEFAE